MTRFDQNPDLRGPVDDMPDGVVSALAGIVKTLRTRHTMTIRLNDLLRDTGAGMDVLAAVEIGMRRRLVLVQPVRSIHSETIRLRRRTDGERGSANAA